MSSLHPVAAQLFALLETRRGHFAERPEHRGVDKYEHALQCASRARRGAKTPDYVIAALFHDVFGGFHATQHGKLISCVLTPFIYSEADAAIREHETALEALDDKDHFVWQNMDEFDEAVEFALKFDSPSFAPNYPSIDIEVFKALSFEVFK